MLQPQIIDQIARTAWESACPYSVDGPRSYSGGAKDKFRNADSIRKRESATAFLGGRGILTRSRLYSNRHVVPLKLIPKLILILLYGYGLLYPLKLWLTVFLSTRSGLANSWLGRTKTRVSPGGRTRPKRQPLELNGAEPLHLRKLTHSVT